MPKRSKEELFTKILALQAEAADCGYHDAAMLLIESEGQGNTSIVVAPEASPIGFVLRRASVQNVINTTLSNVEYHNGSLALKGDLALSPEAHALPTRNGMVAFIEKYMQPFHKNVSDPNQILEFWPSDEQQPPGSWWHQKRQAVWTWFVSQVSPSTQIGEDPPAQCSAKIRK